MATLTVQNSDVDGLTPTMNACSSGGDNFANLTEDILLYFESASGAKTVTVTTPATVGGAAVADPAVTVPASGRQFAGPFNKDYFNSSGKVSMTYSDVVGLTVAVVRAKRV